MDGPPKKATGSCKNSLYSDTDLSEARSVSDGWAHPSPVRSPERERRVGSPVACQSPERERRVGSPVACQKPGA